MSQEMLGEVIVQDVEGTEVFPTMPGMSKEEAEAVFQTMMGEPTPIVTLVMPMNEDIRLPRNKVLLDLTAETEFALYIGSMLHPLRSQYDDATSTHVIKLGFPCVFAYLVSLKCVPVNQEACNLVAVRVKEASMVDADALLYSKNYFVWKHDGMYLASYAGIIGAKFEPPVPSRHYSREEIASKYKQPTVFFNFDDTASA
jgi:hypothetical protein